MTNDANPRASISATRLLSRGLVAVALLAVMGTLGACREAKEVNSPELTRIKTSFAASSAALLVGQNLVTN